MPETTRYGMVIDLTRCIGCDACSIACKVEQGTPPGVSFARVIHQEVGKFPKAKMEFLPVLCNHCEDPPCLKSCPTRAIYKRDDGIVLVDENRCSAERACVSACPYEAIFFPENRPTLFPEGPTPFEEYQRSKHEKDTALKCTFCYHRVDKGVEPACVVTCPAACRIFGDLDDPKSKPSMYLDKKGVGGKPLLPMAGTNPNVLYVDTK